MAELIKFVAGVTLLVIVMALVSADQYDKKNLLCDPRQVDQAYHTACQIQPRRKRDVQADVDDESEPATLTRTKRQIPFEGRNKAEMVNTCCQSGCSVRDFHRFSCP